jgi:hypothetical protein
MNSERPRPCYSTRSIALAIAFGGTGAIVTGYGWLEAAGLPHVD